MIRELEFRRPVKCSVLSERRVYQPYGLHGGEPAQLGLNLWISKDGRGNERTVNMGGKNTVPMDTGGEHNPVCPRYDLELTRADRVCIMTPGGGGYGPVGKEATCRPTRTQHFAAQGGSARRKELQHTN